MIALFVLNINISDKSDTIILDVAIQKFMLRNNILDQNIIELLIKYLKDNVDY